ncbi:MAG: acetoacetate decarboxylase family protein, partial [Acidobacteriota bacterium]
ATRRVRPYLPDANMRPVELRPGRCLVAFSAFEYRKTDIDPYNEFSVALPIIFGRPSIPGLDLAAQWARRCVTAYVWHLPVTTEIARVGGVDLYGYPKFVADISFDRQPGSLAARLAVGGREILRLESPVLPTRRGKRTRYVTYSVKDGVPLVANLYVDPLEYGERWGGGAQLTIGTDHPICDELGEIELSSRPLMVQYAPLTEAVLFSPRNLIDH